MNMSTPFPGPTVASIDANGCLYILDMTGSTTNVRTICPSASNDVINEAFSTGPPGPRPDGKSNTTAPPLGYVPPPDLATSTSAFNAWRGSKGHDKHPPDHKPTHGGGGHHQ